MLAFVIYWLVTQRYDAQGAKITQARGEMWDRENPAEILALRAIEQSFITDIRERILPGLQSVGNALSHAPDNDANLAIFELDFVERLLTLVFEDDYREQIRRHIALLRNTKQIVIANRNSFTFWRSTGASIGSIISGLFTEGWIPDSLITGCAAFIASKAYDFFYPTQTQANRNRNIIADRSTIGGIINVIFQRPVVERGAIRAERGAVQTSINAPINVEARGSIF